MANVRGTLSVLGLLNWNGHLFDDFNLPDGVEREALLHNIILECAELEVLIPDPDIMRASIANWSRYRLPQWKRMVRALTEEYNPLHNYDRNEESTDTGDSDTVTTVHGFDEGAEHDRIDGSSKTTHKAHLYGNIGVTTSMAMLLEELEGRSTDIVQIITQEFKDKFCIGIY